MRLTRPRSLKAIVVIAAAAAVAPALSGRTQSINGAVLHDSAVVFAGHEHITNRVFSEGIDPAQVHLIMTSRADPAFPLARMRVRGEVGAT